jgi:GTP pyrophosphokinase
VLLTSRFEQALRYAVVIHAGQVRKGSGVPYVAHLLGVAGIVLEYGGDEDEAIGALLHDAGEDAGGQGRIDDIRQRFGDAVAEIVLGCTDTLLTPKPPWRDRKEKYIAHVKDASAAVRLVSAADKLHNARAIVRDYRQIGAKLWPRFNGGKEGTLWYYRELVRTFSEAGRPAVAVSGSDHRSSRQCPRPATTGKPATTELVEELGHVVEEMERMSGGGN